MTDEEKNRLSIFEARLRQLIFQHDDLKAKHDALKQTLEGERQALKELEEKHRELEKRYADLKQARIISIHDADVSETRRRLSQLVREIDKCLKLLNG